MELVATCLFGLEKLLGEEIEALGYRRTLTMDGRIYFEGDRNAVINCNLNLRFAERVFISLGSFHASTFDELFEGTKALPWEEWIDISDAFPVKGHCIKSKLFSIPDCQRIVKRAIVSHLEGSYGIRLFPETGVKYQIEFFIFKDTATLMIDTSGAPLHKRGYRPHSFIAPIRETLAAALVKLSRPREEVLLWDPFCGSGTIAIEAALMMTNTAPGIFRGFAAEAFPAFPQKLWAEAREKARTGVRHDTAFEAYASDIDDGALAVAEESIKHAGMQKHIRLFKKDALTITTEGRRGTIVCNPPYGERLSTIEETEQLYRNMGRHFATLDRWQIYVITSHKDFQRLYGRRADKVRKLYNGMIPCSLYQYFKPREPRA